MIEVEKKFILSPEQHNSLIKVAKFQKEIVFTDTYYDTKDFQYIKQDTWLRKRNEAFQLKVPLTLDKHRLVDQYEEITDSEDIKQRLNLPLQNPIQEGIEQAKLHSFCKCTTTRKKYQYKDFIIDTDEVEYEDFSYQIAEIELMVDTEEEVEQAIQKILNFTKTLNLEITPVRGKVIEYLKRKEPEIYKLYTKKTTT